MKVIRLHPNYHGYTLDEPLFAEMLDAIIEAGLAIQIVAQMEDTRTQHPLVQAAPVDLKPLPDLLAARPKARVMVLNSNAAMITTALRGCDSLWLDCAMIEGVGGLENTLKAARKAMPRHARAVFLSRILDAQTGRIRALRCADGLDHRGECEGLSRLT
jgi:hypothetical protein